MSWLHDTQPICKFYHNTFWCHCYYKQRERQNCSKNAWFQTFAAKYTRSALFWVVTQPVVVSFYRRLGTTYRSELQGSTFHTHVERVSGLMHDILIDINVPFWHHPFIKHCAVFCHSHISSCCYMLRCLLAQSSGSWNCISITTHEIFTSTC
jgi:hypothetical protein